MRGLALPPAWSKFPESRRGFGKVRTEVNSRSRRKHLATSDRPAAPATPGDRLSSPTQAPSHPAKAGSHNTGSSWILDPWRDFILIVGPPFLIVPALWIAQSRFRADQIYLMVASFGAVGHHLPGMMRAYGDRFL